MNGPNWVPGILKIHHIAGYLVSCLFNNGESRLIDFQKLFENVFHVKGNDPALKLLEDYNLFKEITIIGSTIGWPNVGIHSKDFEGNEVFYPYDLDPIVLFDNSAPDPDRKLMIGLMIKEARKEAGLTQEELARKSGTSKHYISRIENNKSDIELLTLIKIVEGGLGKRLKMQIS